MKKGDRVFWYNRGKRWEGEVIAIVPAFVRPSFITMAYTADRRTEDPRYKLSDDFVLRYEPDLIRPELSYLVAVDWHPTRKRRLHRPYMVAKLNQESWIKRILRLMTSGR